MTQHTHLASPPSGIATPQVVIRHEGTITRITLNRPRALNALTSEMVIAVREGIASAKATGSTAVLLDGAGDRGFCGGGDVKAMAAGHAAGLAFLWEEYRTDYAIAHASVPVIGIMDGITMGGGIGLTGHAALRVVTERSVLAMPETRIGIAPDVGGNLLFARAPGRIGEMLAISSATLTPGDALALGFADGMIASEQLAEFRMRITQGAQAAEVLAEFQLPAPESAALKAGEWFTPLADAALGSDVETLADPRGAALRLMHALDSSPLSEAQHLAHVVRAMCPSSVAVALAQLARVRSHSLTLAETLADDYRVIGRMLARADFAEGVRAHLIDRDGSPNWEPATLTGLCEAELAQILAPELRDGEKALQL